MRSTVLLALLLGACQSENEILTKDEVVGDVGDDGEPDIDVTPTLVEFGQVPVEDTIAHIETVTIQNVGELSLEIVNIALEDASAPYTISAVGTVLVRPGDSTTFTVTFDPWAAEPADTNVLINSNDPDEEQVRVELKGTGIAPRIEVSPTNYDFGLVDVGCDTPVEVTIANVGNADLVVDDLEYFTASDELSIDDSSVRLPLTIPPATSQTVLVRYAPLDDFADSGFIRVFSNDPVQPEAQAYQTGVGNIVGDNLDTYEQPLSVPTDILFVVDNSCSMGEEQANLSNNFSTFINIMVTAEADYQIAVITTDSYDFRGDVISGDSADPVGDFVDQCSVGVGGSGDERGLEMAYQSTQPGNDAGDGGSFLRDDAKLSIVIVSDEVDSSGATGRDWADYVDWFQSLKDDADQAVVHAIAGDYPGGCATADPGIGYYEAVTATGGLYLSICATDWASHLEALGESAATNKSSFDLTEYPVPETIEVRVDGVTRTTGWTYSAAGNEVQFADGYVPEGGSTIEIEYILAGDCVG